MKTSEYILQSKTGIKHSESLNVTYELLKNYDELLHKETDTSFLQIIPVRIVASNESFFKETFSSILDYNSKFLINTKNLLKRNGTKIDLEDILHITKSKFTIGDLVSYSLTYSSLDTILKNFEEITGLKVFKELDNVADYLKELELDGNLINEDREYDKGRMLKNMNEVYELRNIICHDFLSASHKLNLDPVRLRNYIMDTALLQESISYLCSEYIYTDIPLDQNERIKHFNNLISAKVGELESEYLEIQSTLQTKEQNIQLEKNKKLFFEYLESDSKDFGFWFSDDGPFEDLILEHKIKLLENRIEILQEERKNSS